MQNHPSKSLGRVMGNVMSSWVFVAGLTGCAVAQGGGEVIRVEKGVAHTTVDQKSTEATRIRKILRGIDLPEGFAISLYAMAPDARHMAVGPDGRTVFVGTRMGKVWAVTDPDQDGIADAVKDFAPGLNFDVPNGVEITPDGTLYVAERNRVLMFEDAESFETRAELLAVPIVPQNQLIPRDEESGNHSARVVKLGPDNRLYISLGQPYNVAPREKLALYDRYGIGGIIRMNRDGSGREVYTYGIRNSVGHDFHPVTGDLWFTDNQVDGMGDDIPPGEINRQTAKGQHFGAPWYGGGSVRVGQYSDEDPPEGVIFPASETIAHAADLGMTFYTGRMFPTKYRNAIFSAQHGSWDRSTPVGARVMVTFVDTKGNATTQPFAEGWIAGDGTYDGRPVDVAVMADGSLLVSDDYADAIYRITYSR